MDCIHLRIPTELLLGGSSLEIDVRKAIVVSTASTNKHDSDVHQSFYQLQDEGTSGAYLFRCLEERGREKHDQLDACNVYELADRPIRKSYFLSQQAGKAEKIKDIGRKVRQSLVKEKSNRPEIVRLDDNEHLAGKLQVKATEKKPQRKKRKAEEGEDGTVVNQPKTIPNRQRRRKTIVNRTNLPNNIDPWMPDVGALQPQKGEPSHTIQLHGLPRGCTAGDIGRFFSGLEMELLFGVPSFVGCILEFDCGSPPVEQKLFVPRYRPNECRIFCKFSSAPLAQLASERSGEALFVTRDGENEMGATIAISILSKPFAKHLLKYMALDLQNKLVGEGDSSMATMPVDQTVDILEEQLYVGITNYFWKMTRDTLSLSCPPPPTLEGRPWWRHPSWREIDILENDGFQQLQALWRAYKAEHDNTEFAVTCFRTTSWDPQLSQHPVNKLTIAFINAICDEMELIRCRLDRARFIRMRLSLMKNNDGK